MKILLLDNYDSFTYNLLHVVKELGIKDVEIFRNDQIALSEIERFDKIILSPGPVYRKKPVCYCPSSNNMPQPKVFSAFVWGIKLSAKLSVLHWKTLQMYIMVYKPRFISSKTIFCFRIWSTKYP